MKRRLCYQVIAQMIAKTPSSKIELLEDLKWNLEDSIHKAPEQNVQWTRTMNTLIKHIPKPSEDWELEVLSIFTTKTIEQLRKELKKNQTK